MKRTLFIDADTAIFSSSAQQQNNKCLAIHTPSGREKLFDSKTAFNDWLAINSKWKKEDFQFSVVSELVGHPTFAYQSIRQKIAKIVAASHCDDYYVCIQGEGNFRNDYQSEFVQYKGHRPASKPILYKDCFQYTKSHFGDSCIITSGIEVDDFVCTKGWESFLIAEKAGDRGLAPYVISYVDKDIPSCTTGYMLNYNKLDEGVYWNSRFDQTKRFMTQLLTGDNADNIPGLSKLADESKIKYGIRTAGIGKVSAEKILGSCSTEKELAENTIECYMSAWPDDWKQRLNDMGFFLYLLRHENDKWDVDKYFESLGVKL
jgi:hypothetical protein